MNSPHIIASQVYLEELRQKYQGLKYREEGVKRWFHRETKVFFDTDEAEKEEALKRILSRRDFSSFTVLFIVKGGGGCELMDAGFKNLGGKTVTGFAHVFHANLEYMTRLGLQMRRLEYLGCAGYSYAAGPNSVRP